MKVMMTFIDVLFVLVGIGVVVWSLIRQKEIPPPHSAPKGSVIEFVLNVVALICAAVGPNILVVALTPGMPPMHILGKWVLIPSIVVLAAIWLIGISQGYDRLTNRILGGLWIGAAATATLDAVRLTGFSLGLMPGNMPRMFGVLLLDRMALGPSPWSDFIGYVYHYWAGACFGLTYTLICGRTRWWGALIWGLIIEVGMMTTPPMVVAMDTGFFGLKKGYGILGVSFTAHVVFGIIMGLLIERYVEHKGSIFLIFKDALTYLQLGTMEKVKGE